METQAARSPPTPEEISHDNRRIQCRQIATKLMQLGSLNSDANPIEAATEARDSLDAMIREDRNGK